MYFKICVNNFPASFTELSIMVLLAREVVFTVNKIFLHPWTHIQLYVFLCLFLN